MNDLPVRLRIGDLDEYCIGTVSFGPGDEDIRHQVADFLTGAAAIIREASPQGGPPGAHPPPVPLLGPHLP
ncbi:hypothetical protein ACFYS8_13380 [Kitasatospora sp. NPDC004615]|uniref:hypothetical protein n=1 Tax=Kitasatospora sp. NPDC004615 TaxID=3364017 RepID=UPI0036B2736E